MSKNLMTITEVSKKIGVSTRMLRYYEKEGLLTSTRMPDYSYRIYDEENIALLRQILLLRKLRIPVKEIKVILQNQTAVATIQVFVWKVNELSDEIEALSTIRYLLLRFINELQKYTDYSLQRLLTSDSVLFKAMESLALTSINFMEDKTMENLKNAEKTLSKLTDVRIITIPAYTVAAAHYIGDEPELTARGMLDGFIKDNKLWEKKPDIRSFGFNHPNPKDETGYHGYEIWITIPEDMEVPEPLVKKKMTGGLYAAHMIPFGNFSEWDNLFTWVDTSEDYEFAGDIADQEHMSGLLEEHLNFVAHAQLDDTEPANTQLDLLMPIRIKK